ncbi:RagB/SusD family nutrient uptake outer membrane protein [Pedobacter alpinus]|uniref:RagB/SusD family nutrient uptake outer membrane protein n=1 Tax=Pedobacter alpinus TaxID=1590643 RepID=A0ABW5TS65_9SPHI
MKKALYIFFSSCFICLSSCNDVLIEDYKGGITNEIFYKTADGYKTLVAASYSSLRDIYGGVPTVQLAGTDIYTEGKDPGGPLYRYQALIPDNSDVKSFYTRVYAAIQTVNAGLHYNDLPQQTISATERSQYKAELQFLRAFYHFLLIEQFGGVVINTEFTASPRISIPRSSLADSYNFVITEMETALTGVMSTLSPGRINKDVVNHYLAKVHLTRGWDLNSDADFTKAKSYADAVIAARGPIDIPYANLWTQAGENNREFLFTVQYALNSIKNVRSGGNEQSSLFTVYSGGAGASIKRSRDAFVPAHHIHRSFQLNDSRYQYNFMWVTYQDYFNFYGTKTSKIINYYPVITDPNKTTITDADRQVWTQELGGTQNLATGFLFFPIWANRDKYNQEVWGATDRRIPAFKKFDSPENALESTLDYAASVRDIVLARVAETYFLKAEACIALNQINEARGVVQQVINRPGNKVNATGTELTNALNGVTDKTAALEAYLIETGKEQLGEYNGRWPLLRRIKMLRYMLEKYNADYERNNVTFEDKFLYRPLPQDAIIMNEALTEADQNPGY